MIAAPRLKELKNSPVRWVAIDDAIRVALFMARTLDRRYTQALASLLH
jgi:hypothetical protein